MYKLFVVLLSLIPIVGFSQAPKAEVVKFATTSHSFGKVPKGKPVTCEFTFTNPGKKPLIIEDATAECGCTKPEFPQQPILPGKTAKIKVTYDANEPGSFTKKVTIKLVNVAETKILTILGEVI